MLLRAATAPSPTTAPLVIPVTQGQPCHAHSSVCDRKGPGPLALRGEWPRPRIPFLSSGEELVWSLKATRVSQVTLRRSCRDLAVKPPHSTEDETDTNRGSDSSGSPGGQRQSQTLCPLCEPDPASHLRALPRACPALCAVTQLSPTPVEGQERPVIL